jgi:hypothetical protein
LAACTRLMPFSNCYGLELLVQRQLFGQPIAQAGVIIECAGRPAESRWCKSTTMKE